MMSRVSAFVLFLIAASSVVLSGPVRRGVPPNGAPYGDMGGFGRWIRISTFCEPSCALGPKEFDSTYNGSTTNGCRRYFVDTKNGTYFGYELDVEPVPESGKFIISVKPLRLTSSEVSAEVSSQKHRSLALVPISLVHYPEPQTVSEGDLYLMDLLVNRATGQKIVDEIGVARTQAGLDDLGDDHFPDEQPRDFNLSDVEFHVTGATLVVNGKVASQLQEKSSVSGHLIWFYEPEFGRLAMSIDPQPGFQKIGLVSRKNIQFTLGSDKFEWRSTTPVLGVPGVFNLYVLQDLTYTPNPSSPGQDKTALVYGGAVNAAALFGK
jgi:hypothetical protein